MVATSIMPLPGSSGFGPIGIVLTPDGTRAYAIDRGNGRVHVIDTDSGSPGLTSGERVYVAERQTSEVSVIDTGSNTIPTTIPVPLMPSNATTSVAATPDGRRAYVTYSSDAAVAVIDTDPASSDYHSVVATLPTGGAALLEIAIAEDSSRAFVVRDGAPGDLLVLDIGAGYGSVSGSVPVGDTPFDVALQPGPQAVAYVSNDDSISVLGVSKQAPSDYIAGLDDSAFSNPNHRKTLLNKLAVVDDMIARGDACRAIQKLEHDILPKTDGAGPARLDRRSRGPAGAWGAAAGLHRAALRELPRGASTGSVRLQQPSPLEAS